MRDKSLSLLQFNIQLEKQIHRRFPTDDWFLRSPISVSPTRCLDSENFGINYPKNFRLLRSLAILQWYAPVEIHWRIWLDLTDNSYSQLALEQRVELSILLESKEMCEKYLYLSEQFTSSELFGNILGNDLEDLKKILRIFRKAKPRPRRKVRRRGYRDQGSKRPDHQWLPREDESLTVLALQKEAELSLLHYVINRFKQSLREFESEVKMI